MKQVVLLGIAAFVLAGCALVKNTAWTGSRDVPVTTQAQPVPTEIPDESLDELENEVVRDDLGAELEATNEELKIFDKDLQSL